MTNEQALKEAYIAYTLAEALPQEQERVRGLIEIYRTIPTGVYAIAMMNQSLKAAEQASASGDCVAMIRALEDLRGYKE